MGTGLVAGRVKSFHEPTDFEDGRSPESKEFMETFGEYITEQWGERCKTVAGGCPICSMWAAYDMVNALICE